MSPFTFREEDHTYWLDNVCLPSVTQILHDLGLVNGTYFTPEHADRGTRVHRATEFFDETGTDDPELDTDIAGYLEGWKKFRDETGFTPEHIEVPFYSRSGFAGTIDRIGRTHAVNPVLLDIKSGAPANWHRFQLSAYALLTREYLNVSVWELWAVHLSRDGKYKVERYKTMDHSADWMAIWRVYQLKQGIK